MLSNRFTTNFSQNAAVKKFYKSVNIWQTYRQNFVAYFFSGPPCISWLCFVNACVLVCLYMGLPDANKD